MTDDRAATLAMNEEIQAFVKPFLPAGRACGTKEQRDAYQAEFSAAWSAAMRQTDHIRLKHGFVRVEDAPGWRYGGGND